MRIQTGKRHKHALLVLIKMADARNTQKSESCHLKNVGTDICLHDRDFLSTKATKLNLTSRRQRSYFGKDCKIRSNDSNDKNA